MILIDACKESLNPINIYKWVKYKIKFRREHPDYFDPDGLCIFAGPQGSGKTISAVNYIYQLMELYPKCKLVTNVWLEDYPIVRFEDWILTYDKYLVIDDLEDEKAEELFHLYVKENRVFEFLDNDDFQKYGNEDFGMIFFVDEIQLYLNSLQSKNINMEVLTQISQQRKQRKHIVATSQVFGRMAKPLREQFSCVMVCDNYFGFLQRNRLLDRDGLDGDSSTGTNLTGNIRKIFWWFHNPEMYERYDTYQVIEKGKFCPGGIERTDLYEC